MLALAMLLGSIPFGHIAVRLRSPGRARDNADGTADGPGHSCPRPSGPRPDLDAIRRSVGWPGLALVVALNVVKGFVPVFLTMGALHSIPIALLVGAIAVLSHCFPYWLMFRPMGKGGSVVVGAALGLLVQIAQWRG